VSGETWYKDGRDWLVVVVCADCGTECACTDDETTLEQLNDEQTQQMHQILEQQEHQRRLEQCDTDNDNSPILQQRMITANELPKHMQSTLRWGVFDTPNGRGHMPPSPLVMPPPHFPPTSPRANYGTHGQAAANQQYYQPMRSPRYDSEQMWQSRQPPPLMSRPPEHMWPQYATAGVRQRFMPPPSPMMAVGRGARPAQPLYAMPSPLAVDDDQVPAMVDAMQRANFSTTSSSNM
jgi:hypothetical protein